MMKNHIWVNGQLLQTNKKWSALKEKQKQWIQGVTAEEHRAYVAKHNKLPIKKQKLEIIDKISDKIDERGIWIPYHELEINLNKMLDRLNRKSSLFVPPQLKVQNVVLETERLILRKMELQDWQKLRRIMSDPEVMYAWERVFSTKKDVTEWVRQQLQRYEKDSVGYFVALDKRSGEMIGQIGLLWTNIQESRCLEVGYILKKSCWGKGFATEGAKACIDYGFEKYMPEKIYATIRPENEKSVAVAKRLGMQLEGEFVKEYDGKHMKHLIYSIDYEGTIK